jgi:hypothetical protein
VPETKELFFFNRNYSESLATFLELFPVTPDSEFIVDVTPSYIRSAEAVVRLKAIDLPKKIIVCLRDPIQRAFSTYVHDIYYHHVHYDASVEDYQAGALYEKAYASKFEEELESPHALVRANYFEDLAFLYSIFDREDVLILILERDFETEIFKKKISDFLKVDIGNVAVKSENLGGLLPLVIRPDENIRIANDGSSQLDLLKNNLYIFLRPRDGIAYWQDIADEDADRLLQASYRWTSYLSAATASQLRQWHFDEDIERTQELIGYAVPEWKVDRPLQTRRWFGMGTLKRLERTVNASVSVFGGVG